MLIIYSPKNGEERRFYVDPEGLRLDEIEEIETVSGKPFVQFVAEYQTGRIGLLRPLLYVYLRREDPSLTYKDVNPYMTELQVGTDRADLEAYREVVAGNPDHPNRDAVLEALDADIAASTVPGAGRGKGGASRAGTTSPARRSRRSGKSTT